MPGFDERGHLPPGVHLLGWHEFKAAFGYNPKRRELIEGMHLALLNLKRAGCLVAYIDGSFVTQKSRPSDYDGCWETANVDKSLADPILFDVSHGRDLQKMVYGGEMFPEDPDPDGWSALEYFQTDVLGSAKGIIVIRLGDLVD